MMIDLEKEREAFEEFMKDKSDFVDVRRVVNGDIGEYMAWDMVIAFKSWVRCAEQKQTEIDQLKADKHGADIGHENFVKHLKERHAVELGVLIKKLAKLAKVESGEFVIVLKEPSEKMINAGHDFCKSNVVTPLNFYKAMIEASQENE